MKNLSRILPALALATAILVPVAATADPSHYTYVSANNEATITAYTGPGGDITIPSTLGDEDYPVTAIGDQAFSGCTSLTGITIPNSVTTIGFEAFAYCTSLASVTMGNSVTSIGGWAFYRCSALTSIDVDAANPSYSSLDGVLFNKAQTILLQYPEGKSGAYTIPASVTSIGDGAFYDCTALTSVTVPDGVTTIGAFALAYCTALTSVYFRGVPPTHGSWVFDGTPATIHYLSAHADQWADYPTYAGRPTAPWLPAITQLGREAASGAFTLSTFWAPDLTVTIEATTSLFAPDWTPLLTTTIPPSGLLDFTDPDAPNHPTRFYRVVAS